MEVEPERSKCHSRVGMLVPIAIRSWRVGLFFQFVVFYWIEISKLFGYFAVTKIKSVFDLQNNPTLQQSNSDFRNVSIL